MVDAARLLGRVPPQNLDAEQSLLGGLLLDKEAFHDVADLVTGADFYREAHRKVYEAMCALAGRNEPTDRPSVKEELRRAGSLESVGGERFVDGLDLLVPTAPNLAYYAKIVREKAITRRVIEAGSAIAALGYEQHGDVGQLVDEAQARIMAATEGVASENVVSIRESMRATFKAIETNYERGSEITGLASGLADLDRITAGFQPGELVILAARPSVGKTACAIGWALHTAIRLQKACAVFSLEMLAHALNLRMLAHEGRVDATRLRSGQLLESDWPKLATAGQTVGEAPLHVDDTRGLSALQIRSRARRAARKFAGTPATLGLVVVDYLTLMRRDENEESVSEKVGRNALRMKELAGELNVPVILLAQLNRESAKNSQPRRPVLADLRDSGEIEQHADLVIFIHRESKAGQPDQHWLLVEKQRNGAIGEIPVSYRPEFTRFDSASSAQEHRTERVG